MTDTRVLSQTGPVFSVTPLLSVRTRRLARRGKAPSVVSLWLGGGFASETGCQATAPPLQRVVSDDRVLPGQLVARVRMKWKFGEAEEEVKGGRIALFCRTVVFWADTGGSSEAFSAVCLLLQLSQKCSAGNSCDWRYPALAPLRPVRPCPQGVGQNEAGEGALWIKMWLSGRRGTVENGNDRCLCGALGFLWDHGQ